MSEPTTEPSRAEIHHDHRDVAAGGWLRPAVFGMMDGLVSNFALIAGVTGASATPTQVSLAGVAGLVGGAFSMAAGEYISVQSQNESMDAEVAVERRELTHNFQAELDELTQLYISRGVDPETAASVARQLSEDPEQALAIHAQEELGVDPSQLPSPWTTAYSSFISFRLGEFLPLLPYVCGASSLLASIIVSAIALFTAGAISSRFTARGWLFAGTRQLILGAIAAAVTFGIGALFQVSTG